MSFKETWQNILTKIDNRIPIKKITVPLDRKYPLTSFFLFILIILIVLYLIFGSFQTFPKANLVEVNIRLADNKEKILDNFEFKIRNLSDNTTNVYLTNDSGAFKLSLDKNKKYLFLVESVGYEYFEKEINFEQSSFNFIISLLDVPGSFPKIVYFQDALTEQRIKEQLNVTIVCDNGEVITPNVITTDDGSVTLDVPTDCNALYADVVSDKYNVKSLSLKITDSIFKLNPLVPVLDVGSVYVSVMSGDNFIDESITLKLFSIDDPVNPLKTTQTNNSMATFTSVPVGEYVVRASDLQNRYLSANKDVGVLKNKMSEITINMVDAGDGTTPIIDPDTNQEIEVREITVFVKDKETGEVLDSLVNPQVTLLLDGNQNIEQREHHDDFVFIIDKNKSYSLKATAEGYIPGEIITVINSQSTFIFNLEKITISNVSNINLKVEDEDEKPIILIKALIYDKDGQYIDPRFEPAITDENGFAVFENIPDINFTIKVKNNYIDEISQEYYNMPPEDTNITLPVVIGKGTINLTIKNKLNEAIINSQVTFYSETKEVLGTALASNTGVLQNQVKADKRVFMKIEAEGYLPYFTQLYRIYKDQTLSKEIILERAIDTTEVVTEYLGLYNTSNQEVDALKNNEVFYLKYKIIMPNNSSNFNFTLRAGSEKDVKEDIVFILFENESLGVSVYYEKENFTDSGNFLESKLVNLQFNGYPTSVHEITIPVRIRNAKVNDSVSFFYASSKDPINFMTHNYTQLQYFVDATSLCDEVFCFSGQYVDVLEDLRYDIKNDRLVPMKINAGYILEYTITNSSQESYPNIRFSARNLNNDNNPTFMVDIREYDISGEFSSVGKTPLGEHNFKMPFVQEELLKDALSPFSNIDFKVDVFPLILGQSKLSNRFVSNQEVLHTLPINFSVSELEQMTIDYQPKNIVPGVPFILTVTVKDSKGGVLEGVNVNILQKVYNEQVTVSTGRTTNKEGKVNISLPALRADETFIIDAIKSKYYATPVEFTIKKDILEILHETKLLNKDSTLDVFIHKNDLEGEEYTLTFKNKTDYPLTLKRFNDTDFSFNNVHLLNLEQSVNFLNNQINEGLIIPANQTKDLKIKFAPSSSAITHPTTEEILGSITSTISLNNFDYLFNIPVKIKLSVGKGVLEDNCLISSGPGEWTTVVSGTTATVTLDVRNFCLSKEGQRPISIKNVQAKLTSQGDRYGVYFLRLVGPGSASQVQLSENYYKTVINEMTPEDEYRIEITYNTNGTKFADIKSSIFLNAQVETEEGLEFVNKSPNDLILKTNISVIDLADCFSYIDESGKTINSGGLFVLEGLNENILKIKNNCQGKASFVMDLCEGNDFGCRDLAILNTDEENNILKYSLVDSEKTISIKRKDSTKPAGAYILNNKISVVNNVGREVTSSFVPLRINAKDVNGLWMDDPFIEISENKTSQVVRLYNNDLNKTLWHYLAEDYDDFTVSGNEFNSSYKYLRNIKYIDVDDFFKEKIMNWNFSKWYNYSPLGPSMYLIKAFTNEYNIDVKNFIFNLDNQYLKPELKEINFNSEFENISLVDITGLRNLNFYKTDLHISGKLIKKEDFINIVGSCPQNQEFFAIYQNFKKSDGCSLDSGLIEEEGIYKYKISCSGSFPKNKINLHHEAYLVCKDEINIWPEQAGLKQIQFNIESQEYKALYDNSKKYNFKEILFTPIINENDSKNKFKEDLGRFRFGFFLTKPKETPNYNLDIADCITDTGKFGKTGQGAVPNISLDWSWSQDIDRCDDTYCDATQLTIEVLNRIRKAQELISQNQTSCPLSPLQIMNNLNDGSYIVLADPGSLNNNIPVNKSGIKSVFIDTLENQLKIKVTLENRLNEDKDGTLYLKLGNLTPTKIEKFNNSTNQFEIINNLDTISFKTESNDLLSVIYTFGNSQNLIIKDDLSLNIVYNSENKFSDHSIFNSVLDLKIYEISQTSDCQTPATTVMFNGVSYLDMWLNKEMYPDNVTSPWSQEDIKKLKDLLEFDAYLITDTYNDNFIKDFDVSYGGIASKEDGSGAGSYSIMASPTIFNSGYLSRLFKNNLYFIKEFSDETNNVNVNVPGKYKIKIDFEFNNSSWNFESAGKVDVKSYVTFRFISSPGSDSVFYRLPLNGFVGHTTSGYNRQGYGVSYLGDVIGIDGKEIYSHSDFGSNPLRRINVTSTNSLYKINSDLDSRGNILSVKYKEDITDFVLSPSTAIPILMKITKENTQPLNVYYRLKDKSDNAFIDSTSLLRWSGVGSGCDFSGNSIYNNVYYDRYSITSSPQSSYLLDWSNIARTGTIYLRTVFYVPDKETYTLENRSDKGVGIGFSLNGNDFNPNISLDSSSQGIKISSIKSVFDLIEKSQVCVVNSSDGTSSDFFYNPSEIFSNNFIKERPDALKCN
jgi:hypothetical protein